MPEGAVRTAGMVVSAALAAAIVLAAVVLLSRNGDDVPIQILPPGQGSGTANPDLPADGHVRVYISGAVRNPGVYTMMPGDRLADAVAAAGAHLGDTDLEAWAEARYQELADTMPMADTMARVLADTVTP